MLETLLRGNKRRDLLKILELTPNRGLKMVEKEKHWDEINGCGVKCQPHGISVFPSMKPWMKLQYK